MARPIRPRRSALYMPGANARALEKGRSLPADVLIMDLEDGVLPEAKVDARGRVLGFLDEGGYGAREIVVRVNGIGTPWFEDDLAAVATSGADAAMLPKVEEPATVARAAASLEAAGAPPAMGIWCMLETPTGILDARPIARAHPRMAALTLGTADLSKALHADLHAPDRLPLATSMGLCVLAAREAGLAVLDAPHFDLSDDEGRPPAPAGRLTRVRLAGAASPPPGAKPPPRALGLCAASPRAEQGRPMWNIGLDGLISVYMARFRPPDGLSWLSRRTAKTARAFRSRQLLGRRSCTRLPAGQELAASTASRSLHARRPYLAFPAVA